MKRQTRKRMSGKVHPYEWDIQGDTLIHRGNGATCSGTFSPDGRTLTGGLMLVIQAPITMWS
jgi:hypothetical protein